MAVVINDFEVVAEPPAMQTASETAPAPQPADPDETERLLRRAVERLRRVRAT